MRRVGLAIAAVAAIAASYGLGRLHRYSSSESKTGRRVIYYVDPMHPAYRSDKPGVAPDCGMQLEPVFAEDGGNAPPSSPLTQLPAAAVSMDGATQPLGIRLARAEKSSATRTVRVVGRVVPEDTRTYRINSGVDGFIRETYSDSVGVLVRKDQKLAAYYAPEFLAASSGFLAAVQGVPGAVGKDGARFTPNFPGALAKEGVRSLQGYTDRLRNIGVSDLQINQMAESRQVPQNIDVLAPADGFILARNISPGQHFERNVEFYRIADLSRVWVVAEVYEQEAQYLRPGGVGQVTLRGGGRQLPARITDSLPQSEAGGGTVKLRLEADNPGLLLRPEMLVDVEVPIRLSASVTVPLDALVDSGAAARVYVEHGAGAFEPREVETGWRAGDRVEIRRGVQPGERVVVAAAFLVDSESRLKTPVPSRSVATRTTEATASVPAHMVAAPKRVRDPSCGMPVDPAKAAASGNTLSYRGATYYFCSGQCKQKFQNDPASLAGKHQSDDDD